MSEALLHVGAKSPGRWHRLASALHGIDSESHLLEASTFEAATTLVTYFTELQFKVLAEMRLDQVEKTHTRSARAVPSVRSPAHHGTGFPGTRSSGTSFFFVRKKWLGNLRDAYERESSHGGKPSTIVFLRKFPPQGA